MRMMSISVMAILLAAAGLAILWPAPSAGPGSAAAVAQDREQPAAEQSKPAEDKPAEAKPEEGAKSLADKLTQRGDFEFIETPLKDVVQALQLQTGVQFVLNQKKMEEAGINIDTPITKQLKQVRLATFLDLTL